LGEISLIPAVTQKNKDGSGLENFP
jgi:hypothetical protein